MNTKKIYKVVGIDNYGKEYPITKEEFNSPPQAHKWVSENQNLVKIGFQVKGINVITPEEETPADESVKE